MGAPNFSARIGVEAGPDGPALNIQIFESVFGDQRIAASLILDINAAPALNDALERVLREHADQLDLHRDEENPHD